MTGYGKAVGTFEDKKITIEIKSLNSKFFDLKLKTPSFYREKDSEIQGVLTKSLQRGKVDFSVYVDLPVGENTSKINHTIVGNYYKDLQELASGLGIENNSQLFGMALRMPDTMTSEKKELDKNEWKKVLELTQEAIVNFKEFRGREGNDLQNEFEMRINTILDLLTKVESYEPERIETVKERIRTNLQDKFDSAKIDQNRFEQELIYYVEKFDINEEKVRLKAHCDYFLDVMKSETGQGKKLGFISQEIGREVNTLGSKANHQEIQQLVVQMKDELEKIKEQVLNTL